MHFYVDKYCMNFVFPSSNDAERKRPNRSKVLTRYGIKNVGLLGCILPTSQISRETCECRRLAFFAFQHRNHSGILNVLGIYCCSRTTSVVDINSPRSHESLGLTFPSRQLGIINQYRKDEFGTTGFRYLFHVRNKALETRIPPLMSVYMQVKRLVY